MAGAGKGGILSRVIDVFNKLKIKGNLVAVEKNPYAYMSLLYQQSNNQSWKAVQIVHADLKTWDSPIKFDLIVSEMLGSFGDNELSPECLLWS